MEGLVFIDGDGTVGNAQIADYVSYGPNNEVYLAPGQRVAFLLNVPDNIANIHIGIRSADGKTGTYTITNIAQATNSETGVNAGDYYGAKTSTISTTTDMYYDLTGWEDDIIVISNTGDKYGTTGIISLTNIKSTYTSDPNGTALSGEEVGGSEGSDNQIQGNDSGTTFALRSSGSDVTVLNAAANEQNVGFETYVYMTPAAAELTVKSLNGVEEEIPDATEPEATEPEETQPETTEPEDTEPEVTEPEATEPEVTEPENTDPENTDPEITEPEETKPEGGNNGSTGSGLVRLIKKLLGWLFG